MTTRSWSWLALASLTVGACAQVIGADFDGLTRRTAGAGGTTTTGEVGSAGTGGSTGSGGTETGEGGEPIDADVEGGSDAGGASGAGGTGGGSGGNGGTIDAAGGSAGSREAGTDVAEDAVDTGHADAEPDRDAIADAPKDEGMSDAVSEENTPSDALPDSPIVGGVVINEVNAQGALEDYIELYNIGSSTFDLSGYSVAQGSGLAGPVDSNSLLTFASGTTLDPGHYLLIVANQAVQPRGGPHTPCNVPGFPVDVSCYYVDWGVSKNGERVYLLGPGGTPVEFVDFPTPGISPPSGRSYGRYPDGTGSFQSTAWTPGSANQL
jgi:hypothetical protein